MSVELHINVIDYISHLIRANNSRNTQSINGVKMLKVNILYPDDLYRASG